MLCLAHNNGRARRISGIHPSRVIGLDLIPIVAYGLGLVPLLSFAPSIDTHRSRPMRGISSRISLWSRSNGLLSTGLEPWF